MRTLRSFAALAALFFAMALPNAFAQSSKGIVVGTAFDQSGAVVSGATVTVTNTATNVSRETVTSESGTFRLDAVDPGTYKITVTANGFKPLALSDVEVAAGKVADNTFMLQVGGAGDVIDIVSDAVALQTQDAARTGTITGREITELPVSTLNPVDLVFTLPGVVSPGSGGGFVQGTEFSINGLRPRANNQLIDGTDNNDNSIAGQAFQPALRDAFQEVSILGGNNTAEYGRGGGAVVNLITKSGSNQFHGSVYNLINTSSLSSLTSGQKINQGFTGVPVSIQNQPGFSFGGPILKDKLFFFGTYQNTTFRTSGASATAIVPTANGFAQLQAVRQQLVARGASTANLDRYLSIVGNLRGTTLLRQVQLGADPVTGADRGSVEFGQGTRAGQSQPFDDNQFLTRVDWTPTTKDSVSFRYLFDNSTLTNQIVSAFQGFGIDVPARQQNLYIGYTRTFSPRLLNEFRFSYGRFVANFTPQDPATLNGPVFAFAGQGLSSVGLGAGFPQGRTANNFQYQDTITYTVGNHTIRAGVDLLRQLSRQSIPFNNRGTLTFSAGGGFSQFANFIDGFSGVQGQFGSVVFGSPVIFPNALTQSYFVNDTWRLRPNLTITLGLRYENYGTPFNVAQFPAFDFATLGNSNINSLTTRVGQRRDDNNFAPRIGVAYTPKIFKRIFGNEKTVIRAGYAVSYDTYFNNILSNTAAASPNAFGANTFGGSVGGRGFANSGVGSIPATGSPSLTAAITSIDPNLVNPLIQVYNFGVQRELPKGLILDVAYVGSRGQRLFINEQVNPGVNGVRLNPARGPITLRTNAGDSNYHSLQTRVEGRIKDGFLSGLFGRFAYTYSKSIDAVNSEVFVTSSTGSSVQSNPFNRRLDRGRSDFDATNRAIFTFVYDIPGPKTGLANQLLGGWSLSGTYRLESGPVATPFVGGTDLNGDLNSFNDRPAIGNPNAPANSVAIADSTSPTGYFDNNGNPIALGAARFIVDPAIRTNLAGRNILRGRKTNFGDASVTKRFRLPFEGHQLELRFEAFNIFNTSNFGFNPSGAFNSGGIGPSDVTDPNFNNPFVNDGGVNNTGGTINTGNRIARIQIRYSF
jgi:hypothetical protein